MGRPFDSAQGRQSSFNCFRVELRLVFRKRRLLSCEAKRVSNLAKQDLDFEKFMKTFAKILIGIFIILWILIATCYIYIRLNGRSWVINTLSQVFEQPVQLKDIHFLFPFGARITGLTVGEILQVKDIQLQIGLPDFLHKRFHFFLLNLSEPIVTIQKGADSKIVLGNSTLPASPNAQETPAPSLTKVPDAVPSENPASKPTKSLTLMVDYLLVTKGEIRFWDYSRGKNFQMTLRDVNLKAQNTAIPIQSVNTNFDLKASLFKNDLPFSGSRIQARGWADFYQKNMQATLDVIEPDGKVGLNARLDSKDNNLAIDGKVHITSLISKKSVATDDQASLKGLIFSSLQSSGVEIAANFHSRTKMDDIQFDSILFSGNVGYNKPVSQENPAAAPDTGVGAQNLGERFEDFGKKFYKENIQTVPVDRQELMNKEVPASQ